MNKLTSIQNNIYDDLNVNGFSKIKLFNNKDIADFKIQIKNFKFLKNLSKKI